MFIPAFLASFATFIAQTTQSAATQPAKPGWVQLIQSIGPMAPIIIIMILFVWMTSRNRKRQEQQKKDMINAMKRGDRVQTIGGILGNIVEVQDNWVLVKVDESNNTKVKFARSAIHRVLGEEAEAK